MFKVTNDKPMPSARLQFPFDIMDVGSSFDVENEDYRMRAVAAAHSYARKNNQKFRTKTKNGIMTVWRVA